MAADTPACGGGVPITGHHLGGTYCRDTEPRIAGMIHVVFKLTSSICIDLIRCVHRNYLVIHSNLVRRLAAGDSQALEMWPIQIEM